MLSKKLKKILIGVILGITLFTGIIAKASSLSVPAFKLSPTSIVYQDQIKQSQRKILIYHSHGNEKNQDSTIFQMGDDLSNKLIHRGYQVEHITYNFAKDYNNAYYCSGKMLDSKDLSQYLIVIDLHTNSGSSADTTQINNKDVAKIMWVQTKNNPNLSKENVISNGIDFQLSKFGNISKGIYCNYNKGINFYNLSKSSNIVLLEMGNEKNTFSQVQASNSYLSLAIDNYITSNGRYFNDSFTKGK